MKAKIFAVATLLALLAGPIATQALAADSSPEAVAEPVADAPADAPAMPDAETKADSGPEGATDAPPVPSTDELTEAGQKAFLSFKDGKVMIGLLFLAWALVGCLRALAWKFDGKWIDWADSRTGSWILGGLATAIGIALAALAGA